MRIHHAEVSAREAQDAVQEAVQSVMGAVEDTRTDLWSIHSEGIYSPEVVEEVQSSRVYPVTQEEELPYDLEPEYLPHEPVSEEPEPAVEEADFQPIRPRRVEIIHEPEADYVAEEPELSTSAVFAEMGIFGNREPEGSGESANREFGNGREPVSREFGNGRESGVRRAPVPVQEEPRGVDIRFAQGKDNGRNSNERILELHKAGKSNMAIAKELGLGLGEVKLVIDLFEGM